MSKRVQEPEAICCLKKCDQPAHNLVKLRCKDHCLGAACYDQKCGTSPSCNKVGEHTRKYCGKHKKPGMINVTARRCAAIGCAILPSFNAPGESKGKYCATHQEHGMINVIAKACRHPSCSKQPSYNYPSKGRGIFCATHKLEGMINSSAPMCEFDGCSVIATFGKSREKLRQYCANHKKSNMINIANNCCRYPDCLIQPTYNILGKRTPEFCKAHKHDNMIDVRHRRCQYPGCATRASQNIPGKRSPEFCAMHRCDGMLIVTNASCRYPGCRKHPSYGKPGKRAVFCATHKQDSMISVVNRRCYHPSCEKQAGFNISGTRVSKYCASHAQNGMIDVRPRRRCQYLDCITRPTYNTPGEPVAKFCKAHKCDSMINVLSTRCAYSGCDSRTSFGPLFEPKTHCAKHRSQNEYRSNRPICTAANCKAQPYYTNDGTSYPKRCEDHKIKSDVNIVERPCSKCGLEYFIPSNRTKCNDCYAFFTKKARHVKEERIKTVFESNGVEFESHDRIIQEDTTCSQKRPDFVIDKGTFKIIVEVDEGQHLSYECSCEQNRMRQLYFDLGGLDLVIIRYNPDGYTDQHGAKKNPRGPTREKALLDLLRCFDHIDEIDDHMRIYYMYYDGYTGQPERFIMDPYLAGQSE